MPDVIFEDNRVEVKNAIDDAITAFLYEAAGLIDGQAKRLSPVDTGQLKNSWSHTVDESKQVAKIGSPLENAVWNEYGTGEYAVAGNGRKGGWKYQDAKGNWHSTYGKRPQRTLETAFEENKEQVKDRAGQIIGRLGD